MRNRGRVFTGLLLFFIGVLLLLKTANWVLFPSWFFTWPMIFIAIGLISAVKHGFRGGFWFVFLLIGGIFLVNEIDPTWHMDRFVWPIILIAIGIGFILRPRRHRRCYRGRRYHYEARWQQEPDATGSATNAETSAGDYDRRDFIDITAVFGGIKKKMLSKNFQGGDVTSFMGGSEIDLSQSDFSGRVTIDVTNVFGGTKLIVPPTWELQNDITAVFGGVDDKRQVNVTTLDPDKVLVLDGTCLFGGIEIRSF